MDLFRLALAFCTGLPTADKPLAVLDFGPVLSQWSGEGFRPTPTGVTSNDPEEPGRVGVLQRTFVLPKGAGTVRARAGAFWGRGGKPSEKLDIVLFAGGNRVIPKQVRAGEAWKPATFVAAAAGGQLQEYQWAVSNYAGQTLRLGLVDDDARPGHYLTCDGFQILGEERQEATAFSEEMVRLSRTNRLPSMTRYDSKNFIALSNADEKFSENQLRQCELLYALFFDHFRKKGLPAREPGRKMMVAMFDSQAGFEAYLGRGMSPLITGMYHPASNRLVVYDYGQNKALLEQKRLNEREVQRVESMVDRQRYLDSVHRWAQDSRAVANIATTMHEVAHQLSFNCGMLNREGDAPIWLVEGLACYCESSDNGSWQGIGAPNPERSRALAEGLKPGRKFIPLRDLAARNDWLYQAPDRYQVLVGYGQSWALFSMLLEEQPKQVAAYLRLIYDRKTPDHRFADFAQCFGKDWDALERRYTSYLRKHATP